MKTLEQKAKAYDEALERAKKLYEQGTITESLSYVFPELKESEEDRIRKEITELIMKPTWQTEKEFNRRKELAVWLEKQEDINSKEYVFRPLAGCDINTAAIQAVEQQKFGKKIVLAFNGAYIPVEEKTTDDIVNEYYSWLKKQGEQKPRYSIGDVLCDKSCTTLNKDAQPNFEIVDIRNGMYICDKGSFPISQQDEYELVAKKIEPKFHEGDWVVWQDKCYKVNYNGCWYELIDQDGLSTSLEFGTVDTSARLWDITKDANDGDVLVSQYNKPFIYNGNRDSFHVGSYCGISVEDRFNVATEKCHWTGNVSVHPATKEQRDLLFQKMGEALYEWDAKEKELKKIHVIDEGKAEMDYCFTKMMNGEKVSPAWSEEDERLFSEIMLRCKKYGHQEQIDWLKSIKQRIGG